MSEVSQIQELMALASSANSAKLDRIIESIASKIEASAQIEVAEAFSIIRDSGEDPRDFISVPVSVLRARQAQRRMAMAETDEQQARRHADELHQLELRKRAAEVAVMEASAASLATPVHS